LITRLAQFAIRRPVLVLVGWALAVAVLAAVGQGVEQKLMPTTLSIPGTESHRWKEMMEGHLGESAAVLLRGPPEEVDRQGSRLQPGALTGDTSGERADEWILISVQASPKLHRRA
jgi:hypothetical protein